MEIPDQPVLAWEHVRYQGEPVAIVAADHPETARRAAEKIAVEYEVLEPLTDPEEAMSEEAPQLHPSGNLLRHIHTVHGDAETADAEVVVTGEYAIGMQDQAFLGPESGLAVPDGGGGEDLSMQAHACLLALHTERPVKMMYDREESFFGHVHRHPARMRYEHGADRDGKLVYVKARIVLDGGAYASSSTAVCSNAASFSCGPYDVPNALVDTYMVYTNNPPCGAMRGFGAVQVCFAYESQMDKLARELRMDPLELRIKNAIEPGNTLPFGQEVPRPAPVAEILRRVKNMPLPEEKETMGRDLRELPGGVSNVTHGEAVKRGVGYSAGFKNVCYSEGFDDYSTARVTLSIESGEPLARVHTAAAEVGQGLVTIHAQVARTELGVERVSLLPADTRVGSSGSSSASRQTYMTGGAVKGACEAVRERVFERAREELGDDLRIESGELVSESRGALVSLAELLARDEIEETFEFHHKETFPFDENGQGNAHVQFAFAAHRAVVDVDTELGLVRVVEIAA